MGAEPLNARLTVMVTGSMLSKIESRSGGHVAEFVRKALSRTLSGQKAIRGRKSGRASVKRVRRYGK